MSDHGTPEEPGKDRAWLSITVIASAMLIGALTWNEGRAAPKPSSYASQGPEGVVYLKDGSSVRGTILKRGSGVVVLDTKGHEHAYPWSQIDDRTWDLQPVTATPRRAKRAAARTAKRADDGGTVVLKSGEVYVGRIRVNERSVSVTWPYKSNRVRGSVTFPRNEIRWFGIGVEGPTREYWRKYPNDKVVGHTNPLKRNDPLIVEAELSQNEGKWAEATRRWSDIYKVKGFRQVHFLNLDTCARKWVKYAGDINASEAAARRLGDEYLAGQTERAGVRRLLGDIYLELAKLAFNRGRNKSAREFATRLKGLGPKYSQHGEQMLKRMRGE